jgi:hypothetical protein
MAKIVDLTLVLGGNVPQEQPAITDRKADVDRLIECKRAADQASADFTKVRRTLEMVAGNLRIELEEQGKFTTKVQMVGTQETVDLSYTDQFKTLTPDEAEVVRTTIGKPAFKGLFEETRTYNFKGDLDRGRAAKLRKLLTEAGEDPSEWIESSTCFSSKEDFRRTRFELRKELNDVANVALDLVVARTQYEPRLNGVKWAGTAPTKKAAKKG